MRSPTFWRLGITVFLLAAASLRAAETEAYYYDETQMRHLVLKPASSGATQVEVRFAAQPGSAARWMGEGQRKDKELTFSRVVGEGEDRGTFFVAEVGDSKVVIRYKPNQTKTEDAGILGIYRRVTEGKMLQLARKEFQSASDKLVLALKNAVKGWESKDKPALVLWKEQWPGMRQKWMDVNFIQPGPVKDATAKGAPAKDLFKKEAAATPPDKLPDYWFKLAEATQHGSTFVDTRPDPKTRGEWEGEYDDFAGGHASLRQDKDGKLRLIMNVTRSPEESSTGTIEGAVALPEKISKNKDGNPTAEIVYAPANIDPDADPAAIAKAKEVAKANPATIHLTKIGRYLRIETEHAERFAGHGWFDGIYRGGPVPAS